MSQGPFEREYLLNRTSYPACQANRLVLLRTAAWITFLVVVGVPFAWTLIDFDSIWDLIRAGHRLVQSALFAGTFLLCFLLTAMLMTRVSQEFNRISDERWRQIAGRSVDWPALVVGVLIGLGAWLMLAYLAGFNNRLAFLLNFFSLFPLLALLFLTREARKKTDRKKKRSWWRLLVYFLCFIAVITLVFDVWGALEVTRLHQYLDNTFPQYRPFWTAAATVPLAYLLWLVCRVKENTDEEEEEKPPTPEPVSTADPEPPPWIHRLIADLPEGVRAQGEAARFSQQRSCGWSQAHHLARLFGGHLPSEDQHRGFLQFRALHEQLRKALPAKENPSGYDTTADLIIESETGAGRTSLLVACAFEAAIRRGQTVLWLVPDREDTEEVLRRIEAVAQELRISGFFPARELTLENLNKALSSLATEQEALGPDAGKPPADPAPMLWVATLDQAEEAFFGTKLSLQDVDRLQMFLALLQVIIIDDYLEFPEAEERHLPFFLDKQRLLVEAIGLSTQFVYGFPPLADFARELAGQRLCGSGRFDPGKNRISLSPRPGTECWRLRLIAENPTDAVVPVVKSVAAAESALDMILYRPGMGPEERNTLLEDLRGLVPARNGRIDIVSRPGAFSNLASSAGVLIGEITFHQNHSGALVLNYGNSQTVLIELLPEELQDTAIITGAIPVFIGAQATPFLASHLLSAARVMPRYQPVPAQCWNGLNFNNGGRFGKLEDGRPQLQLSSDRSPHHRANARLWPWMSITQQGIPPARPVEVYQTPAMEYSFVPEQKGPGWNLQSSDKIENNHLEWVASNGKTPLNRFTDLSLARELRVAINDALWAARSIDTGGGNDLGTIHGVLYKGNGSDYIYPVWKLAFSINPQSNLRYGEVGHPDNGFVFSEAAGPADNPFHRVQAELIGRVSEYGRPATTPVIGFHYPVRVHVLALAPAYNEEGELVRDYARRFDDFWKTEPEGCFWPELTAAFLYAMEIRAGGYSTLCRSLAFDLRDRPNAPALAVIFILEPAKVGQSIKPLLDELLAGNPPERLQLFRTMEWMLGQLEKARDFQTTARRFARNGFSGDKAARDLSHAQQLARYLMMKAEEEASSVYSAKVLPLPPPDPKDPRIPPLQKTQLETYRDSDAIPWAKLIRRLSTAMGPGADDARLSLLVRIYGIDPEPGWFAAEQITADLAAEFVEITITGDEPAREQILAAFIRALETGAAQCGAPDGAPVTLLLWAPSEEIRRQRRIPRIDDEHLAGLAGAFRKTGLVLTPVFEDDTPLPPPPPPAYVDSLYPFEPNMQPPNESTEEALTVQWQRPIGPPPRVGVGDEIRWTCAGNDYSLRFGFASSPDRQQFIHVLNNIIRRRIVRGEERISPHNLLYYILNDPYLNAIHELGDELRRQATGLNREQFANYLLSFVQSFTYLKDPDDVWGDWPRFPTEHIANAGGDCEDSSILYAALMLLHGYDTALLKLPGHAAIGVAGKFEGVSYNKQGKDYYYAETASHMDFAIGLPSSLLGECYVLPFVLDTLPGQSPICLLAAELDLRMDPFLHISFVSEEPGSEPPVVAAYAHATDGEQCSVIAAFQLPGQTQPRAFAQVRIPLSYKDLAHGRWEISVAFWQNNRLAGRWARVASMLVS